MGRGSSFFSRTGGLGFLTQATRFRRDRSGAVQIEFAMLALPFFVLVFSLIEICFSFTARQMVSYTTDIVARQLQTGQLRSNDITLEKLHTLLCGNIQFMVAKDCPGLSFSLGSYTSFKAVPTEGLIDGSGKLLQADMVDPGGSATISQLNVVYRWPLITDVLKLIGSNAAHDGKLSLFSTITWQNEPFPEE